jgi:transposase-like protein
MRNRTLAPRTGQMSSRGHCHARTLGVLRSCQGNLWIRHNMKRRSWSLAEKIKIVSETFLPGESLKTVAQRHRIHQNNLSTWRRMVMLNYDGLIPIALASSGLPQSTLQDIKAGVLIERRRKWSFEDKIRIVAESYRVGESVTGVARRHSIYPNQLFFWRRWAAQDPEVQLRLLVVLSKHKRASDFQGTEILRIRRSWSSDDKRRIVREAAEKTSSVSKVAQKYKINPSQIIRWRRELDNN